MAVIVPLPTRARTGSALQKSKSNIVKAHRKKVSFEFALERANSVCFTNCCRNTVPCDTYRIVAIQPFGCNTTIKFSLYLCLAADVSDCLLQQPLIIVVVAVDISILAAAAAAAAVFSMGGKASV